MPLVPRISTTRVRPGVRFVLALAAMLGVAAPALAGPIELQASGGWYTKWEEVFAGAGARLGFGGITVIPNAEWLFVDHGSTYTLNIDGTMNVLPLGVASGYVGAGVGWFTVDLENAEKDTKTTFNVIAGAGLNAIPLKPFGQLKWIVRDGDDPVVLSVGARF